MATGLALGYFVLMRRQAELFALEIVPVTTA